MINSIINFIDNNSNNIIKFFKLLFKDNDSLYVTEQHQNNSNSNSIEEFGKKS
jgi:hypothetical protein